MITGHIMSPRVYLPVYSRRFNRYRPIKLIARHCSSWYILRSSTFSLCPFNGSSICNHRWIRSLIPTVYRIYTKWCLSKNSLYNYICRSQYHILSTTFPRFIRYTSTILRLPRCLHSMKYSLLYRLIYLINSSYTDNFHNLRSLRIQTRSTNGRTHLNKRWMTTWMPSPISHIWRANLCIIKIRKEGIEPPKTGFKPMP